tara:strand:+ start:1740 stop:4247 length:2508 start_codon:yes stop_codon:yes gene_type:complete
MAKLSKDSKQRKADIEAQSAHEENLADLLMKKVGSYKAMSTHQRQLLSDLKGEKDMAKQIETIHAEKEKIIKSTNKKVKENMDELLANLDRVENIVKKEKERKTLGDEMKSSGKEIAKDLGSMVGLSGQVVDGFIKGGLALGAFLIIKEIAQFFLQTFTAAKGLSTELGMSYGESVKLTAQAKMAAFSFEGMMLGADKMNSAMQNLVKTTGNVRIDTQTIKDVAMLTESIGSADAVSLARSLENAGHNTKELMAFAKEHAKTVGGTSADGMKFLAQNQFALNGMTEEDIQLQIKKGIRMKQIGADMEAVNKLASEALDIESSIKNEMKLRMMTGKDINMNALRAAQVQGDSTKIAEEQAKLIKSLGPALATNLQMQRLIGDATGMTKEQMLNYANATGEAGDRMKDNTAEAGMLNGMFDGMGSIVGTVLMAIAGLGVAMLALWGVSKLFSFFKLGNPVTKFIGDFGSKDVLMGAAAMVLVAGSMLIFAMAMGQFGKVMSVKSVMATVLGMALLGGAMALLAFAVGNPMTAGMLYTAAGAMLLLAASFLVFGLAIMAFGKGLEILAGLGENIGDLLLVSIALVPIGAAILTFSIMAAAAAPFLLIAGIGLLAFGVALIGLGLGMGVIGALLPVFVAGLTSLATIAGELPSLALGLGLLGVALIPFGFAMSLMAGALPGLLIFAGGLILVGLALSSMSGGMDILNGMSQSVGMLVSLVPGLFSLAAAFGALGLGLAGLSYGLAAVGLSLPVLLALSMALPIIADALGFGGGDSESSSSETTDGGGMSEVVNAIKSLDEAVRTQPIVLQVNSKTVQVLRRKIEESTSIGNTQKSGGNK